MNHIIIVAAIIGWNYTGFYLGGTMALVGSYVGSRQI